MHCAGERQVRPGIARESNSSDSRLLLGNALDHFECIVVGMVVNDHPFPAHTCRIQDRAQALEEDGQVLGFAVCGSHDREQAISLLRARKVFYRTFQLKPLDARLEAE